MKRATKEAVKNYVEATAHLLDTWQAEEASTESMNVSYPFAKSFDEVLHDVIDWRDAMLEPHACDACRSGGRQAVCYDAGDAQTCTVCKTSGVALDEYGECLSHCSPIRSA